MSNRRNRRSIWSTLARRRRAAAEALRFLPNRAPALSKLFAGTALGCSFLAFAAPGAAKAQSIDNTNLPANFGYIGTTNGSGEFRSFGYAFHATDSLLQNLTVYTAQYDTTLTTFHLSLYEMTGGDLNYSVTQGHTSTNGSSGSASANWQATYGTLGVGDNYARDQHDLNWQLSGGVVGHADGVTFSQPLGDTNVLIKAPGASGVSVESMM